MQALSLRPPYNLHMVLPVQHLEYNQTFIITFPFIPTG